MTEHTIAMAQGNRVTCTCGQVFTASNRTDALVQLLDHAERAEAQDDGA